MRLESNTGTAQRRFIRSVPLCLLLAWTSSSLDPATRAQPASSARPELVLQVGHLAQVNSIAFTADGRTIVTASDDRSIRLWDAQTGELLRVLTGHSGPVSRLALSPDGKILASGGGDGTIRLWSVETWDTLQTLKPGMAVRALAFSPDRRLLAAGCAEANMQVDRLARGGVIRGDELFTFTGAVKVWNYLDGSLVRTLEVQGGVDAVDFLSRDTLLLTLMLLPPKQGDTATEEWVAFTPEGYFDASPGAGPFIRFRSGSRLLPLAEGWEKFRRPAVVRQVLQSAANDGNIQR